MALQIGARVRTAASPTPPRAGLLLKGRYKLEEPLGAGGGGEVWRASDLHVARKGVAVKVLAPGLTGGLRPPRRMRREVEAMALVQHPAVPLVSDHGRQGRFHFIVMELLEGRDLADVLEERRQRRAPLPPEEALPIFFEVLEALATAHDHGVVHRDLKPDNVVLSTRGHRVYLLDFGLARHDTSRLTAPGDLVGTLRYMAPEQAHGEHRLVGSWSDTFAAGVLLHELLTNRPHLEPEVNKHAWVTATRAAKGQPIDRQKLRGVPDWLIPILQRALHGEPDQRFQDAGELLRAVRSAARAARASATRGGRRR